MAFGVVMLRLARRPPIAYTPFPVAGPVAQLDRALPSEGRGHRFESCRVRHSSVTFLHGTLSPDSDEPRKVRQEIEHGVKQDHQQQAVCARIKKTEKHA